MFISTVGTPLSPRSFARQYKMRIGYAKLPYLKPHALRHTAATLMPTRGLSLERVSSVLGHASVDFTKRIYTHWVPSEDRRLTAALEGFRAGTK